MQRHAISPRPNWQAEVEKWGMVYHTHQGAPYWHESAYYTLTSQDVERLESATQELHNICLETVKDAIKTKNFRAFDLPVYVESILEQIDPNADDHLYGRFDLAYDGVNPPIMLEYNADTPTALLEAAVVQWQWAQDRYPGSDQFNSLWEALIERWKDLRARNVVPFKVHFAYADSDEDVMTVALLRDTATEAGLETDGLYMQDVGWNAEIRRFTDLEENAIHKLFKLYPWEWLLQDKFGEYALDPVNQKRWLEPVWKMLLSNKAILAELWRRYPNHPNLLPAYLDGPNGMANYVRKPLLSREGDGVQIHQHGTLVEETPEDHPSAAAFAKKYVYQGLAPLFKWSGNTAVIGSWVIGNEPAGIGIRETDGWITTDLSRFVPHLIRD